MIQKLFFFFHLFQKHFSTQGKSWSRCNVVSIINRKQRSQNASKVRKQAQKATKKCDKRAQRTQRRLNPPSVYSIGETVYVRLRGKALNKRFVVEASIERRNSKLHTYKVSYTSPHSGKKERKWVPVDDITSITLQLEKQKQQVARLSKRKKQEHRKKYLITKGKEDYAQAIEHSLNIIIIHSNYFPYSDWLKAQV